MLGQEHSRTFSPDMLSEATLYNHFFAKEIERIRYSPYPHPHLDDMKIAEVSEFRSDQCTMGYSFKVTCELTNMSVGMGRK